MKVALRVAGGVIAAGLIAYFVIFVAKSFDPAAIAVMLQPRTLGALLAAACLYALIIPLSGFAWKKLLLSMGQLRSLLELSGIMGTTQAAKYLPGNIAQHATRAVLSLARGMPAGVFGVSVVIETALAVAAAVAVALALLALSPTGISALPAQLRLPIIVFAVALPFAVILLPMVMRSAMTCVSRLLPKFAATMGSSKMPSTRAQGVAFLLYVANYLLIGFGFLIVARSMGLGPSTSYLELTAAFAAAWVAGFLAPGMPAGLGVREGTMVVMLGAGSPNDALLGAVALMRAATVLGDLLWFVLGTALLATVDRQRPA